MCAAASVGSELCNPLAQARYSRRETAGVGCCLRRPRGRAVCAPVRNNPAGSGGSLLIGPSQLLPQYLPDVALRQFLAEVDVFRHLVASEGFAAVLDDILLGELRVLWDDVQGDDLAGVLVRLSDGGALEDAWMRGSDGFDFVGIDVET